MWDIVRVNGKGRCLVGQFVCEKIRAYDGHNVPARRPPRESRTRYSESGQVPPALHTPRVHASFTRTHRPRARAHARACVRACAAGLDLHPRRHWTWFPAASLARAEILKANRTARGGGGGGVRLARPERASIDGASLLFVPCLSRNPKLSAELRPGIRITRIREGS